MEGGREGGSERDKRAGGGRLGLQPKTNTQRFLRSMHILKRKNKNKYATRPVQLPALQESFELLLTDALLK